MSFCIKDASPALHKKQHSSLAAIIVPRSRRRLHRLNKNNTTGFFLRVYAPNCSAAPFHGGHLHLHLYLYHPCATSSHISVSTNIAHMDMNASATIWRGQPSPTYSAYSRTSSSSSYRSTPSSQTSVAAADLSASSPLPLPLPFLRSQPRIQISSLLADPHSRSVTINFSPRLLSLSNGCYLLCAGRTILKSCNSPRPPRSSARPTSRACPLRRPLSCGLPSAIRPVTPSCRTSFSPPSKESSLLYGQK